MRLPQDANEWHGGHLARAVAARDAAFARYERRVDFANLPASEELYAAYLRREDDVENLMLALYGRRAI